LQCASPRQRRSVMAASSFCIEHLAQPVSARFRLIAKWRYDRAVAFFRRVAAVLVLCAFSAAPVLVDWCAANCETARRAGIPSCHHATSSTARISPTPVPCGQDHHPLVLDAASIKPFGPQVVVIQHAAGIDAYSLDMRQAVGDANSRAPSRSSPPLGLTLPTTLRI